MPSVVDRVQCWRKDRSGPIAVPKEMQPTAMPRNFQKRASLSTCVEINQGARGGRRRKILISTQLSIIQIVVKLDDAKGFEAYPPEGGEDLLLSAPYIRSLDFLVRCPPEIAWHILSYWRCQYSVETDMIDQLGYR